MAAEFSGVSPAVNYRCEIQFAHKLRVSIIGLCEQTSAASLAARAWDSSKRSLGGEVVMVEGDEVPEQVRQVLDNVMQGLRDDRPDRAPIYRELTYAIGLEYQERIDAAWWEALCIGCAFDIEAEGDDPRLGDVQFTAFGSDAAVPFELRQRYPHPTLPRDLPEEVAARWWVLGRDESLHPALQARMADLMWVRGDRSGGMRWFEAAVDAYVRLSERRDWHAVDRCMGLRRAISIAAGTRRQDLMDRCDSAAQRFIRESVDQGDGQFGLVYPLFAALVSHDRGASDLLDDAIDTYRADPEYHNHLLDLKAAANPESSADVAKTQIGAFEQQAMSDSGFGRLHWLRRALDAADHHGDSESVARLLAAIERVDVSDGARTETFEHEVDTADVEAFAEQFAVGGGLAAELAAWSGHCPLEEESSALASAQAMIDQYLHLQLVSQVVYDENGSIRDIYPGTEEQLRHVMHQNDSLQIQFFGNLFGREGLRAIIERNSDELGDFETLIQRPWIDEDEAARIASALRRWHGEELNQNDVRLLTLCIESIIRSLHKAAGVRTTQLAPRGAPGTIEPMALGGLLNAWQDLPPLWARYFRLALLELNGLKIRNSVGHAADRGMNTEGAFVVLFHIVCFLGLSIRLQTEPRRTA